MAESRCIKIRLKPGKTDQFLQWAHRLPHRMDEVRAAMKAEGMISEHIFLDRSADGDFIMFYTKAENLVEANRAFEASTSPLDLETKKIIADTWDTASIRLLEPVVEL